MARAEIYPPAKFRLDPSNHLATVHQLTDRTDRQDRQDRQRSDSIGRTVLQTVAAKNNKRYSLRTHTMRRQRAYTVAIKKQMDPRTRHVAVTEMRRELNTRERIKKHRHKVMSV